jgi:hypothetical protein
MNFRYTLTTVAVIIAQALADDGISYDQFCQAAQAYAAAGVGTPPKPPMDYYNEYVKVVGSKLSLPEQAFFMANCVWESGGLQFVEEIACKTGTCSYGKYYGRGFIQLTHDYNYKAASEKLYGNASKYLDNPDLVAKPTDAWKTALWFWENNVQSVLKQNDAVAKGFFGYAVKVINGGIECPASKTDKAGKRLAILKKIQDAWGIKGTPPTLNGC